MPRTKSTNTAIAIKKELMDEESLSDGNGIVTLSTGVRVRLTPVSSSILDQAANRLEPPEVPSKWNEEHQADEENPDDPMYTRRLAAFDRMRGLATYDAIVLFGVHLVDPLPVDEEWLKELKIAHKRGLMDLSAFDLDDPVDLEFLYKRYFAVPESTIYEMIEISVTAASEVQKAATSFQRNAARRTNN